MLSLHFSTSKVQLNYLATQSHYQLHTEDQLEQNEAMEKTQQTKFSIISQWVRALENKATTEDHL